MRVQRLDARVHLVQLLVGAEHRVRTDLAAHVQHRDAFRRHAHNFLVIAVVIIIGVVTVLAMVALIRLFKMAGSRIFEKSE